ncbi:efflux RND transporter periplasmic adaptor subunit [Ancylobacter polymorphus]|uniref:Efflux RND transporter periplasmic adaptor subunit n=1 Tax=Ancylobacter polymorphus TaxID=223390 RepID=A0A9E6ZZY7_9HYPH|nr:efflux RND transporter periplasmic adaptor subunit [Ancylobacter polymorphus]UOK73347.1 efflux RND transporter periplasmic adaptor subunit [Ancylobacter polymorphus]
MTPSLSSLIVLPAIALMLTACDAPQGQTQATPPPPLVKTLIAQPEDVPLSRDYPGRLLPIRLAEVRARVSGIVLERKFAEGTDVRKGDVLFEIDPARFQAEVASAKAQLARAQAALVLASQQSERVERLLQTSAASKAQFDAADAGRKQAEAEVAVAMANLQTAELELGYASVRSPIDGRIGPALVTEGALMRQEDGTPMATIRDLSSVYVDFTAPLAEISALQHESGAGLLERPAPDTAVELIGNDGTVYGQRGRLLFSSAVVDEGTGQVSLRAEFPNPENQLLPGTYVRVRMRQGVARQALLVPQRAVLWDTLGQARIVTVKDGLATVQPIVTARAVANRWMVREGLKPGDQIIVDGAEKLVPGSPVTVESAANGDGRQTSLDGGCDDVCEQTGKI